MEEYVSSTNKVHDRESLHSLKRDDYGQIEPEADATSVEMASARSLVSDSRLGGRGNGAIRAASIHGMQRTYGSRAVQRFMSQQTAPVASEDTEIAERITSKSGGGLPLHQEARTRIEDGLGADLTGVRVHTDAEADQLARSVNSVAFTSGQDIFFRSGAYDPQSSSGLRLLAHEATHTLQQSQGPVDGSPTGGGVSISDPSDSFEQEAERTADAVIAGQTALPATRSAIPSFSSNNSSPTSSETANVQRSIFSGDNLENDFWGTKALLGDRAGGTVDAGVSAAWNLGSAIPGVGSWVSGIGATIDGAKSLTASGIGAYHGATGNLDAADADAKAASRFTHDAEFSAAGMIPGFGTYQGIGSGLYDLEQFGARAAGSSSADTPLSGDLWDKQPVHLDGAIDPLIDFAKIVGAGT